MKALESLKSILEHPYSEIVRDAAIQRFEYSFELVWKLSKEYLREVEGLVCASPKACFRRLHEIGMMDEKTTERFLLMTDRRNETTHTYREQLAREVFGELAGYLELMSSLCEKIGERL